MFVFSQMAKVVYQRNKLAGSRVKPFVSDDSNSAEI
jgi:hypothetical protein